MGIAQIKDLGMETYNEEVVSRIEPRFAPKIIGTHTFSYYNGLLAIDFAKVEQVKAGWSGTAQARLTTLWDYGTMGLWDYGTMGQKKHRVSQHREHAARGARRADPRCQQLRAARAGLAADPEQLTTQADHDND
jgi:hypothetical protein